MDSFWMFAVALVLCGAVSGFMAGLLGIGGGAIIVPVLYDLLGLFGVDDSIRTHMAVATSLAVILPVGVRSVIGHNGKRAVDWAVVKQITPFVILGVGLGAVIAKYANGDMLRLIYGLTALSVALFLLWSQQNPTKRFRWPQKPVTEIFGVFTGLLSTLMGIGGGTFISGFMTLFGRTIHQAVGTGAAIGPVVALPAMAGFIWAGWGDPALPPYSLGFISLIGTAFILPSSLLMAPIGVTTAHKLSHKRLEQFFIVFLFVVSARFLYSVLG